MYISGWDAYKMATGDHAYSFEIGELLKVKNYYK
jgi:hypothetical protein